MFNRFKDRISNLYQGIRHWQSWTKDPTILELRELLELKELLTRMEQALAEREQTLTRLEQALAEREELLTEWGDALTKGQEILTEWEKILSEQQVEANEEALERIRTLELLAREKLEDIERIRSIQQENKKGIPLEIAAAKFGLDRRTYYRRLEKLKEFVS